jgi:hypothetical protein
MHRTQARILIGVGMLLLALAVASASAESDPPYKIVVRGPGIDGEHTVWLTDDPETLQVLHSGLLSETPVEAPGPSALPYEIVWYFGSCWAEPTPCQEDPDILSTHATRYAYDSGVQRGALSHLEPPDWFEDAPARDQWYRTTPEFDRAIQRILVLQGAPAEVFQPVISIFPSGDSPGSMGWIVGVAVLVIVIYLMRRGQTDK